MHFVASVLVILSHSTVTFLQEAVSTGSGDAPSSPKKPGPKKE